MNPTAIPKHCRNCGAALAGEYCSRCGQREGRPDRGFRALAGEVAGELFSWDSRLWRTILPLLFRPGFLTAQYIAGRRARYVPPLRLYLIISFVMFLVMPLTSDRIVTVMPAEEEAAVAADADPGIGLADESSPPWLRELDARLEDNAARLGDNPAAFTDLLLDYLPQMMFLMLPVFALLLQGWYLFSGFHYLQHLIFSLHYYSFAYLLYLLGEAVRSWFYREGIGDGLLVVLGLYLVIALRRTYGSGWLGATGKAATLLLVNAVLLLLAFSAVVLLVLALA